MIKNVMLACSTQPDITKLSYPLYASFKLDGIRCATPEDKVLSRKLKPIPNRFIQKKLQGMPVGFDGELMVRGNFNEVDSAVMSFEGEPDFTYFVFDLCDDKYKHLSYTNRLIGLESYVKELGKWLPEVKLVEQKLCLNAKEVQDYYDKAIAAGYEGLILRSPNSPYKEGRSTLNQQWMLKLKPVNDTEATVYGRTELLHNENMPEINNIGGTERNKQQAGMVGGNTLGALLGTDKKGQMVKVGSGFTAVQRQEIWDNFEKYQGKQFTFKYQEVTPDGAYRFPVFKGWRSDV
jgi:DNA ligase 1